MYYDQVRDFLGEGLQGFLAARILDRMATLVKLYRIKTSLSAMEISEERSVQERLCSIKRIPSRSKRFNSNKFPVISKRDGVTEEQRSADLRWSRTH